MHRPAVLESLQEELQQTPSLQIRLEHCVPVVQLAPLGLSPQELFTHVLGDTQSASRLHVDKHALPLQTKVPQDTSAAARQPPRPSQLDAGVCDDVLAQAAALHGSPSAKNAHAPARQVPVAPQVDCATALHCSWGSGAPSGTALQSPNVAARLQALHASVQAALQHTPCEQYCLPSAAGWHSFPALQAAPAGLRPHDPLTQLLVPPHCPEVCVHDVKHFEPLHAYGKHVWPAGGMHWPLALHVDGGV